MGAYISLNKFVLGFLLWNFISTTNKCPILSSWETLSKIWLNCNKEGVFIFLCIHMVKVSSQPSRIDYFHPSLESLLLSFFFSFTLFAFKSNTGLWLSTLSLGNRICKSKARRVFMQLNLPFSIFSKRLKADMFSLSRMSNYVKNRHSNQKILDNTLYGLVYVIC